MGNKSVLSEIGSLMSSHPYVSCSLLVFLTPPFFPILKFFSPLLISTALFVVALVTMGPHFEQPPNQDDDFLMNAADFKTEDDQGAGDGRDQEDDTKPVPSSWLKSWKESSIAWVEKKLQNENWKGSAPNDNNVSILQEAFAHRAPQVLTKLVTRRIPDDEEEEKRSVEIPALSHSDSWTSDRSFDRLPSSNSRDHLPHNLFSPHPSFSRRQDSDVNPLYEDVIPPPIDYDMPPLITGPASLTAPLFKSLEEDDDMDYTSDDEYDHHHSDHEHLEVGESTVLIPHDHVPLENGIHDQAPVEENLVPSLVDEPMDSSLPSTHEASPGHLPSTEERSVPVPETHHQNQEEVHDIPELEEDVLPVDTQSREINPAEGLAAESLPDEAVLPDSAPTHDHVGDALPDSAPTHDHVGEALSSVPGETLSSVPGETLTLSSVPGEALSSVPGEVVPPYVVERSMSLPVHGSSGDTESHEELPALDTALPEEPAASLSHAISLPAALHPIRPIILPPKTTDQGPASPDTDLGTATTFEAPDEGHNSVSEDEPSKQLSTKEKLLNIEALSSSSMPATENEAEQVAHVTGKMKSFVEDAKKFQPDAPQLQITPPSSKVVFAPSPGKPPVVVAGAGPTIRLPPSSSFPSRYSSDDSEEAGDEETDLEDSDVEVVGEDSDSDLDLPAGLKAPQQPPPVDHHIVVQA